LRNDGPTEYPGERITNGVLEFALDALNQTLLVTHLTACLESTACRAAASFP
jgi:hypothetical protein